MDIKTERQNKVVTIGQLLPEQLQTPVTFEQVELTEEEAESALAGARVKKHERLEYDRKKKLAEVKLNDLRRPWQPNELYDYARARASQILRIETGDQSIVFEPTEFQKPLITALTLYFTNHPEFESLDAKKYNKSGLPFSLQKGIWLWGNPGVGKTLMMEMFSRNRRLCYKVLQCPKIVFQYVKSGDDPIRQYCDLLTETDDALSFYQVQKGVCYNDLGVEQTNAKHYGTAENVMERIFLETYENKVPFFHRHVTTNLPADQLKEVYGVRFVDRVKQCFNIIEVNGESLRGKS